ncbi:MAG: exodeoxyribonuclease V subunit alpha, partial [Spirochaetaceae bacterium]
MIPYEAPPRPVENALLDDWVGKGFLRPLDRALALFLLEQEGEAHPLLVVAAALTSFLVGQGHTCLDLQSIPDTPGPAGFLRANSLEALLSALRHDVLTAPEGPAPLALVEDHRPRLYLKRYYRHEQTILRNITERLHDHGAAAGDTTGDAVRVRAVLDRLFRNPSPDWARIACALAIRNRFSVITGGPGTGKTTTVVRVLAALCLLEKSRVEARTHPGPLRIRLAAPTGKAATRLQDSIMEQLPSLPEEVREFIPRTVSTVHRLLRMHRSGLSRYTPQDSLPADLVVIDEASMMDVELTARLMDALPEHGRLILLGDKDQLSSVESGSVLADICLRAEEGHYTPDTVQWLREATGEQVPTLMADAGGAPLDQAITMLRFSYRFSTEGGIGRPAEAIRRGAIREIPAESGEEFRRLHVNSPGAEPFREVLRCAGEPLHFMEEKRPTGSSPEGFDQWARDVLRRYNRYRLLCVLREGPWGVIRINEAVRAALERDGLVPPGQEWYPGRPVMVTRNDYRLDLMNGDIGVALQQPAGLYVAFEGGADRDVRWILPGRLQAVETVFAMTVHKSQGSEFDHVVLVMPDRDIPVLTREVVYTGITRARKEVTLVESHPALVDLAASRSMQRSGGLGLLLH